MKIVFLDYDGVLNNPYYILARQPRGAVRDYTYDFDPVRVEMVRRLCTETGAKVVVTSSWRNDKKAIEYLKQQGVPIIDITDRRDGREDEIQHWVETYEPEQYVILDDETASFGEKSHSHLVYTRETVSSEDTLYYDYVLGLQPKHIKFAKTILEGE